MSKYAFFIGWAIGLLIAFCVGITVVLHFDIKPPISYVFWLACGFAFSAVGGFIGLHVGDRKG